MFDARKISTIFVWSDVGTLLIQATGRNFVISHSAILRTIAKWTIIVRFVLQLLSFSFSLAVFDQFGRRIRRFFFSSVA
jgi:hypothetical protein